MRLMQGRIRQSDGASESVRSKTPTAQISLAFSAALVSAVIQRRWLAKANVERTPYITQVVVPSITRHPVCPLEGTFRGSMRKPRLENETRPVLSPPLHRLGITLALYDKNLTGNFV